MLQNKLFYIFTLFLAGLITSVLAMLLYKRRNVTGAKIFTCFFLATSIYSWGYAFELYSSTLSAMMLWSKIQYIGCSTIPCLWGIAVAKYVGKDRWLTRPVIAVICVIPFLTIVLHATDEIHHLFYSAVSINNTSPFPLLVIIEKGPWYWVQLAYTELLIIIANFWLINKWLDVTGTYRHQISIMLLGSLIPWVSQIVYHLGQTPWKMDINPFTFTISGLIFAWGVFHYRLFDLVPIARELVFDSMQEGVLVFDKFNRLIDFNSAAVLIFDLLDDQAFGCLAEVLFQDNPAILQQLTTNTFDENEQEILIDHAGVSYYYKCRISPIVRQNNKLTGNILVLNDVTPQRELMEQLRKMAAIDNHTKIYNRMYFLEFSRAYIAEPNNTGDIISVIMIDIDNFKSINDNFGHHAGDIVLQTFTDICKRNLRRSDIFGRYGGDEFVVFLPDTTSQVAYLVADHLRILISENTSIVDDHIINITASFGIVTTHGMKDIDMDTLLRLADEALYKAKDAGRNCVMTA